MKAKRAAKQFTNADSFQNGDFKRTPEFSIIPKRIANIKDTIETMHECEALHIASERVIEHLRGEAGWDGIVETFEIHGHPNAARCYAWSLYESGEVKYVTVLELPPVDSAGTAAKFALLSNCCKLKGNLIGFSAKNLSKECAAEGVS